MIKTSNLRAALAALLLSSTGALAQAPAPAAPAGPAALDHPGQNGDAKAALELLLAAIEKAPTDPQVPFLLGELRQHQELVDGGRALVEARLQAVLRAAPPSFMKDDLLAALSDLRRAAGDAKGAEALLRERGFVREWVVAGGFGLAPAASLHEPYEPELAAAERTLDLKATYEGHRARVEWTPLELEPHELAVPVGRAMTGRGAATYALTHLEAPAAGPHVLVYTGPSARVWVNRALVATIDRTAERLDSELRLRVTLRQGWNRVLVKVADGRGGRFALSVHDPRGAVVPVKASRAVQPIDAGDDALEPVLPSDAMARLALARDPGGQALFALGLMSTGRGEEAWTVLEDLRRAAPDVERAAWFQLLVGDAAQRAEHLPGAQRRDLARSAYRKALELEPKGVRARRRLAEFHFQDDQAKEGILLLEEALALAPGDVSTRLRMFDALQRKGWLIEAERALVEAEKLGADLAPALRSRLVLHGRRAEEPAARAVRERLLAKHPGETWVLTERLDDALARGDRAAAEAALTALEKAGWSQEDLLDRRLQAARALGDRPGEVALRRTLAERRPWDLERQVALAQLLAESALTSPAARAEAISLLQLVLAREPGRHAARRLLEGLEGREDRFWEEWTPDVREVMKSAPPASHWPRAATVCLHDQTVTRVGPDGSTTDVVHQLWMLLDESGKERYKERPRAGELLVVRTITPKGEVLEPINAEGSGYQMPGLTRGAVIEHAYRSERGAPGFQYTNGPFYFQDPDLTEPFWLSRWVIWLHKDAPVAVVERNLDKKGITREVVERGEWKVYIFTAKDQPRYEPEPAQPDKDELLPWVKLVEKRSLEEIGEFYREAALARAAITPSVARKAQELTVGIDDDLARARALFAFVQEHVTKPGGGDSAAAVLAAGGGSKATLLLGLLRAAGVPHSLLYAAPAPEAQGGPVDWTLPEPGQFSIPIIRLEPRAGAADAAGERTPVYLDPEAPRYAPFGRLPAHLWNAPAFVCDAGGGTLDTLPPEPAAQDADQVTVMDLQLAAGGAAKASIEREWRSYGRYALKEQLRTAPAAALKQFYARQANELFPGGEAKVIEAAALDVEAVGVPVRFRLLVDVPKAIRPRGDGALVLAPLRPTGLKEGLAAHRERQFDIVLSDWIVVRDTVHVDLGPYAAARLPANVLLKDEVGQFSLLWAREGDGRLRIERSLTIRPGRVKAARYPEFRELLTKIDEAERRTLVLEEKKR